MKLFSVSLILLALSSSIANQSWNGIYKVVPNPHRDPLCCLPDSNVVLSYQYTFHGSFDFITGYWTPSVGCKAFDAQGYQFEFKTDDNDSTLVFPDTDARVAINVTIDNDVITLNTKTTMGDTCNATLVNDTDFTWLGTYAFTAGPHLNLGCCYPETLTIAQDSDSQLKITGTWNRTGLCVLPDVPDEALTSNWTTQNGALNQIFSGNLVNLTSTKGLYTSLTFTQWNKDHIDFELDLETTDWEYMTCYAIARRVSSVNKVDI